MISRRPNKPIAAFAFFLALGAAGSARAQYGLYGGAGYPSGSQFGLGYGAIPYVGYGSSPYASGYGTVGGYGSSPYGYGIGNGRVGSGYQAARRLYNNAYQVGTPQTITNYQPLYNMITSLPGWNGSTYRARRRLQSRSSAPRTPTFDEDGKILWPSTIPDDPALAGLRRATEEAVRTVVQESKSRGHASVRPVIDAKHKLWAFEHKVVPQLKSQNPTDGAALEGFFLDLDRALDVLTFT